MKKLALTLLIPCTLGACAQIGGWFSHDPDAGEPAIDHSTSRSVDDVIECLTQEANRHRVSFKTTAIPQGQMLDFGNSNVIKVRRNDSTTQGATSYRFYAGKRHEDNLWIEGASKTCAP